MKDDDEGYKFMFKFFIYTSKHFIRNDQTMCKYYSEWENVLKEFSNQIKSIEQYRRTTTSCKCINLNRKHVHHVKCLTSEHEMRSIDKNHSNLIIPTQITLLIRFFYSVSWGLITNSIILPKSILVLPLELPSWFVNKKKFFVITNERLFRSLYFH